MFKVAKIFIASITLAVAFTASAQAANWAAPTLVAPGSYASADYDTAVNGAIAAAVASGYTASAQASGPCIFGNVHRYWVLNSVVRDPRAPSLYRAIVHKYEQLCF